MSLSITGFDSNGRIVPKGVNVVIPPESAGIGDLIYKSGSAFKVIGRGTANSTTIDGYTLYGIIYGFAGGEAMIIAPQELGSKTWGTYVSGMPSWGAGTVLMRNGQKTAYYAQMNTAQNSGYISQGSGYPDVLTSAYQACGSQSGFPGKAAQGTWNEYIRQTLRVNGAPGSPFGAVATNVKVHEFGRWMAKTYATSSAAGTAMRDCYEYLGTGDSVKGTWWLPSMFELGELMIDEHLNLVNQNTAVAVPVSAVSGRWSCVLLISSERAWTYYAYGMSNHRGFGDVLAVRPVSLFKLK